MEKIFYPFTIFLGAGLGGVFRYWVTNTFYTLLPKTFPYGTLIVNISGCFLMGFFFIFTFECIDNNSSFLRTFLLIGFLGGYTTFSTFSIETLNLFESGAWLSGFLYTLLSLTLCLIATLMGIIVARQF